MKKVLLICFGILLCNALLSQERSSFEINQKLGRGINIGNTFEAPSETEWGNPWKMEYAGIIADLGFNHVRLPVRWETRSGENAPYTIQPAFFERIQSVVEKLLENNLYVIVNMHHHEKLLADPSGQKARFLAQWKQIAEFFKDYPDKLLFEILNEPNDKITPELWNEFIVDALAEIRKTNPQRTVLIGTAEWGGIGGLNKLQLPDDKHIIATIHYYNPFEFTHQGADWSNMENVKDVKWYDSEAERATIHSEFEAVKNFSTTHNVPIHIGEFGAYSKADIDSRVRWTTYLARWFEEQGFSWAYWEFSAGFGIYNPATNELLQPLADALLKNSIPEPAQTVYTSVYESNFSNGTDGWAVYPTSPAKATLTHKDNSLEITITSKGSEGWHIQPNRVGMKLEKGQMYKMSFKAWASNECYFTNYMGRNSDPWEAYSGYNQASVKRQAETFSYTFTMSAADDPAARFTLDMGTIAPPATIRLSDIKLQKVEMIPTGINENRQVRQVSFYYNQKANELFIQNDMNYQTASVYTSNGVSTDTYNLTEGLNCIRTHRWSAGLHLIHLQGKEETGIIKVLKNN